jgi:membrane protein required for colicin V production
MNLADWVILGTIVVSILLAASQGFFYEVFSLTGVIVGYLLAAWEYGRLANWLTPYVKSEWVAEITAFLVIFLAVVILAGILGRILRWLLKKAGLRWFDRLLGAAFGLARGVLLVAITLLAVTTFASGSRWLAGSELAPYFIVVARAASWVAPAEVRARFRQGAGMIEHLRNSRDSGSSSALPSDAR